MSEDNLYHYTTQEGLLGIVEKGEIWATNIFYLNDAAEFKHAFRIFSNKIQAKISELIRSRRDIRFSGFSKEKMLRCEKFLAFDVSEQSFYESLLGFIESMKTKMPFYVCSFSKEKDQLG